jgi:DNA-binding FadR family transcriptional regulator
VVAVKTIGDGVVSGAKVSERLAERLRGEIANGRYRPGEMLPPEAALMRVYGVGRPSVREAMRILESDGLVKVVRGATGGAVVLELDVVGLALRAGLYLQLRGADLADLRAARGLIDPGAVALAAERADPEDVEVLRGCVERVRRCRRGSEFGEIAADFVEALLAASGNQTMCLFGLVIDRLLRQEFHRFTDDATGWVDGVQAEWFAGEWEAVVGKIAAGDGQGAVAAWMAHREKTIPPSLSESAVPAPLQVYPQPAPAAKKRPRRPPEHPPT